MQDLGHSRLGGIVAVLCIGASACSGGGSGPAPGTIQGVVREIGSGTPVVGAAVRAGTEAATTGADGAYALQRPPGTHTLTVSAAGYAPSTRVAEVASSSTTPMDWRLSPSPGEYVDYLDPGYVGTPIPAASMDYVILAWNDLGMHCAQDDYAYFLILPPYNTLHVQVLQRGGGVVTSGITVTYEFPTKTNSTLHTNFWDYAPQYGLTLAPNVGLTGNGLSGTMAPDGNGLGFVATGIPITPWDDDGTWNPYGKALIKVVQDGTLAVLQTAEVVAPVSTELNCANCHGNPTTPAFLDILRKHDTLSGTHLEANQAVGAPHLCAECHGDNALSLPGVAGVKNLSLAMHGFHATRVTPTADATACYNCHPGPNTQCLRGQMFHAGVTCQDCHGDLAGMAAALDAGRQPWLEEPGCGGCHGPKYAENANTLYRNSVLLNTPRTAGMDMPSSMSGKLYCEACHNSTHAEFPSTNAKDGSIPQKFQGDDYWIWNCWVCHTDYMPAPSMHF
jgi:mono/diheme cytochrome c family protein